MPTAGKVLTSGERGGTAPCSVVPAAGMHCVSCHWEGQRWLACPTGSTLRVCSTAEMPAACLLLLCTRTMLHTPETSAACLQHRSSAQAH